MMSNKLTVFLVTTAVLLFVAMYGSLGFTVWNLKTENAVISNKLQSLEKIVDGENFVHMSDQASVFLLESLKRIPRQASTSRSATEILADALTELIEKKLYTLMECARDENNLTDCSLKPGPKGEKGDTGEDGTRGQQGEPGAKGQKGHYGSPGYKGEVGPRGFVGQRGLKGDTGAIGSKGDMGPAGPQGATGDRGLRGETGLKGQKGEHGFPGYKGTAALVQRETRGYKDLQDPEVSLVLQELKDNRALLDTRERREKRE